jgi:hypothetical protein
MENYPKGLVSHPLVFIARRQVFAGAASLCCYDQAFGRPITLARRLGQFAAAGP